MQLTPWQSSRVRTRSRCSRCYALECTRWKVKNPSWRIVQLYDKLELYHDTKWAQSNPWRNEFFHIPSDWGALFPRYMRAVPRRIWCLLHRQSFIHDVSSADPSGLRALCLCILCSNAIALHRFSKVCDGRSKHTVVISVSSIKAQIYLKPPIFFSTSNSRKAILQVIQNGMVTVLGLLKIGKLRSRRTSARLDKTSWKWYEKFDLVTKKFFSTEPRNP